MRQITRFIVSAGVLAAPAFAQVYIADSQDNEIRVVSTAGIISTSAGNGTGGFSGDGGPATSAELKIPFGLAVDSAGNEYIADSQNNRIRMVNTTGIITTVAGTGTPGFNGDGILATKAWLNNPTGVAVDALGDLYIADEYNNRIRRVDHTSGNISTVAGTGAPGFSGDGGLATSAQLYYPSGIALDSSVNLYIADSKNQRVRMVLNTTSVISTLAGNGTTYKNNSCSFTGAAGSVGLNAPTGVAVDGTGDVFIADTGNLCIREVTTGNVKTVAGNGTTTYNPPGDGHSATSVGLNYPTGVAVDAGGNLYIVDDDNNAVRKVAAGIITTFAGSGAPGCSPPGPGNGGPAVNARLCNPTGVAVQPVVPPGSCQGSSSLSVLVSGTNVSSYVPLGNWSVTPTTGIAVVKVEGSPVLPTTNPIPTADTVNSCGSNPNYPSGTGEAVCTANTNHVYVIPAGTATPTVTTLTSAGTGAISFSGGTCTNCGVSVDGVNNRAVLGLALASVPGFQFLDLTTNVFGTAFPSPAGEISEDPLLDPVNKELLSADENGTYEIIDTSTISSPTLLPTNFHENPVGLSFMDSSAEECSTRIALAPQEGSSPTNLFIADLKSAVGLTPGSPSGPWTDPVSQTQPLTNSVLSAGGSGSAIAQGTHIGVITGEFGGNALTAIQLPTSGDTIATYETCSITGFSNGFDPHTVTAYQSPNGSNDAIALLANAGATTLERVDLTMMLTLPSATTTHVCTAAELTTFNTTMVTAIPVP